MSILKFKRKPSGLDSVYNAFELQKDIMNLVSDKKKFDKIKKEDISDKEIIEILVSKGIETMFFNNVNNNGNWNNNNANNTNGVAVDFCIKGRTG